MTSAKSLCAAALVLAFIAAPASAQEGIQQQPIAMPAAGKTISLKGKIRGDESIDYTFTATAGQKLRIDFKTASTSVYFNLLQDGKDEALHIGSIAGSHYQGTLPVAGNYRVRVYLVRAAARRKASANYQIALRVE